MMDPNVQMDMFDTRENHSCDYGQNACPVTKRAVGLATKLLDAKGSTT